MSTRIDDGEPQDRGRVRRRRHLAGELLALVVATGVVVAVVLGGESSSSPGASNSASASSGATTVQRRDLTQTDTESGTLSYANTYTVYNRLSGTITSLPAVGQVIKPGQALYRVGNVPVILMDGSTPAYRDLKSSDGAGPDILELNRNLVRLGFDAGGIVVNDEWQSRTTEGVDLFQESLGETQTGDITLGQVVFLPGDQLISSVSATVGSTGAAASYHPPAGGSGPEFVSLNKPSGPSPASPSQSCKSTSKPKSKSKSGGSGKPKSHKKSCKPLTAAQTIAALTALLEAETAQLNASRGNPGSAGNPGSGSGTGSGSGSGSGSKSSSGSGSGSSSSSGKSTSGSGSSTGSGAASGAASAVMQTSSTELVVTVDLDATKQSEARVGERVQVELPNNSTVGGRITAVSPVAQSSSSGGSGNGNGNGNGSGSGSGGGNGGGSSGAVVPVTIALLGHEAGTGLDQAAVSVNFSQAQARNVLSVPVTALLATGGGNYAVQDAAVPHRLIAVQTGLFAAGFVEISGPGIYPGLAVTDSQG